MQLGAFSISLAVKDIGASRAIYAWGNLGSFTQIEQKDPPASRPAR